MAQTKQFESIIRRTNKETFPVRDSEKRIIIENATGKAVDKTSIIFGTYTYYIVSDSTGVRNVPFTSSVFPITDSGNRKINISIDCQISCPRGSEVKLAESLHQVDKYPGNKLDEFIERWLLEFIKDKQTDFIDNFFQTRDALVSCIIGEAKNQLGLDFHAVRCLLEGESQLETIHLTLRNVSLRFADSVREHSFTADITLLVDSQSKINAIARRKNKTDFEELLKKQLSEYFFNHVRIEDIYSNHESVENAFKTYTRELLRHYGRRIGAILLEDEAGHEGKPLISLEKKITVYLDVPEYPREVEVENQIFITRADAAKYNANKPENFEKWLVENVERVVKQVYFGRRYYEIIRQREDLENKVKVNLKNIVEGMGYNLDQIIIIPTFDELKILKEIEFNIDEKFITRDQQEVKLKVSVKAEGDERSKEIIPYLKNIQILPRKMRSVVLDEIKQYIHTISSQNFYENFDDEENPQATVKARLTDIINDRLKCRFEARTHYLSFDIGETEIIKRMDDLRKEWHQFEIEIKSVADGGVNNFSVSFKVESNALGLWNIFQTQRFSIQEIKIQIITALTARLSSLRSGQLNYQDERSRLAIEELIRDIAFDAVKASFGLSIIVRDVYRRAAPLDENDGYALEKIRELKRRRIDAISDGDIETAREIGMQINYLNESLENNRLLPSGEQNFLADGSGSSSSSGSHRADNSNGK